MRRRVVWDGDDQAGAVLRSLRESAKMTQRDLAAKLGCAESHISKVENGAQLVTVGEFVAWCVALEADVKEAIGSL